MGSFHVLREVAICERHDTDVAVNFLEDDYQRSCNRCIRWSVGALYHVHTRSTQRAMIDGCPVGGVFRATKSAQNKTVLGVAESKSKWNVSTVDDLMAPGFYLVTVSSGTGLPFGTCTFMLLVIGGKASNTSDFDRCAQIAICIYASSTYSLGDTKIRCKASTGWTEWRKVTMS